MARKLKQSDHHLTVLTFKELARAFKQYAETAQRERREAGYEVDGAELRGHNHVASRILYWVLTLSEADQVHIQEEGGRLYDALFELPEGYKGPLPLEQRTASVFNSANSVDSPHRNGEDAKPRATGSREVGGTKRSKRTG